MPVSPATTSLSNLATSLAQDGTFSRADGIQVVQAALANGPLTDAAKAELADIESHYQDTYDVGGRRAIEEFFGNFTAPPPPIESHSTEPFSPDAIVPRFVDLVNRASQSVDIAVYEVSDPAVLDTLKAALARGVQVRIVTDDDYYRAEETAEGLQKRVTVDGEIQRLYDACKALIGNPVDTGALSALQSRTGSIQAEVDALPEALVPHASLPSLDDARTFLTSQSGSTVEGSDTFNLARNRAATAESNDTQRLTFRPAYDSLTAAGATIHNDHASALTHDKYMVIDNQVVWMGSYNLQGLKVSRGPHKGLPMTADNVVVLPSAELAKDFEGDFNEMMVDGLFHRKKVGGHGGTPASVDGVEVTPYFCPDPTIPEHIADSLNTLADDLAQRPASSPRPTVRVAAFTWQTDDTQPMVDAILRLQKLGCDVKVVMDHLEAKSPTSVYGALTGAGIPVEITPFDAMMHDKFISVQDGDAGFVWTGSANFTSPAYTDNDESVVRIDSGSLAGAYGQMFDRLNTM